MLRKISILFFISCLFPDDHYLHDCGQELTNLIQPDEPFLEFKKEKCYNSEFIESRPVIDGLLIDELWGDFNKGNYINDFLQEEPVNMGGPRYKTLVKILHDNENIYILDSQKWIFQNNNKIAAKLWYSAKIPFSNEVFLKASESFISSMNGFANR